MNGESGFRVVVKSIKERVEEYVVATLLHLLQVRNLSGASRDVSSESFRDWLCWVVYMDAMQVVFILKVIMLMHSYLVVTIIWKKGKQPFTIDRL